MSNNLVGKKYKALSFAYKLKYWRDKYKDTPNGWVVAGLLQQQYLSETSKMTQVQRRRRKNEKRF